MLLSQMLCNIHSGQKHSSYPLPQLHRKLKAKLEKRLEKVKEQFIYYNEQKDKALEELQELEDQCVSKRIDSIIYHCIGSSNTIIP